MATTTKRPFVCHCEQRLAALEEEVYSKRADAAYFDFWDQAVWIMVAAIIGIAIAFSLIVWIKG